MLVLRDFLIFYKYFEIFFLFLNLLFLRHLKLNFLLNYYQADY